MKKTSLLSLALICCTLFSYSQDRIYKTNGNILFAEVKQVVDSGVIYIDQQGLEKITPLSSVRVIKYALGNVLPISGPIARKYRDDAYVFQKYRSQKLVSGGYNVFSKSFNVGFEYFFTPSMHRSLAVSIGHGLGGYKKLVYYETDAKTGPNFTLDFRRYTSLLRTGRFFYGIGAEFSTDHGKTEIRDYATFKNREFTNYVFRFGIGPLFGLSVRLSNSISLSYLHQIQLCGTLPSTSYNGRVLNGLDKDPPFVNMQGNLRISYILK